MPALYCSRGKVSSQAKPAVGGVGTCFQRKPLDTAQVDTLPPDYTWSFLTHVGARGAVRATVL